ncbi:Uncharacterised protein [Streptococcus pneumoniae]|nr:Uncharacterised protein [Streptococcus pneumoniae]
MDLCIAQKIYICRLVILPSTLVLTSLFDKMGIRKRPFEWLFLIHDFLTLKVWRWRVWGFFYLRIMNDNIQGSHDSLSVLDGFFVFFRSALYWLSNQVNKYDWFGEVI